MGRDLTLPALYCCSSHLTLLGASVSSPVKVVHHYFHPMGLLGKLKHDQSFEQLDWGDDVVSSSQERVSKYGSVWVSMSKQYGSGKHRGPVVG